MGITACHARTRLWGTDGENVIVSILKFLIDCVTIRNQTKKHILANYLGTWSLHHQTNLCCTGRYHCHILRSCDKDISHHTVLKKSDNIYRMRTLMMSDTLINNNKYLLLHSLTPSPMYPSLHTHWRTPSFSPHIPEGWHRSFTPRSSKTDSPSLRTHFLVEVQSSDTMTLFNWNHINRKRKWSIKLHIL